MDLSNRIFDRFNKQDNDLAVKLEKLDVLDDIKTRIEANESAIDKVEQKVVKIEKEIEPLGVLLDDVEKLKAQNTFLLKQNARYGAILHKRCFIVKGMQRYSKKGDVIAAKTRINEFFELLELPAPALQECYWLTRLPDLQNGKPDITAQANIKMTLMCDDDRIAMLNNTSKLEGKNIYLDREYTPEVKAERDILMPYYTHLKKRDKTTALIGNRLRYKGKFYTVNTIKAIPYDSLNFGVIQHGDFLYFSGHLTALSNLFMCVLKDKGTTYHSAEQMYQFLRAKSRGNDKVAQDVLDAEDSRKAMYAGKQIPQNYPWKQTDGVAIMQHVIRIKHQQCEPFRRMIDKCNDKHLKPLEATKHPFWGCGATLSEVSRPGFNHDGCEGNNQLGKIIAQFM